MGTLRALAVFAAAAALLLLTTAAAPPSREVARLKHELSILKAKVKRLQAATSRLAADNATLNARWGEALRRERALKSHLAAVDPCPITHPNGSVPPGPTFGAEFHGNGKLWVGLWTANVVVWQAGSGGSIDAKFGWCRGVPGSLRIEGRRLDASAPPLVARIPGGYGDAGFQASEIIFPTGGCWQVTGSVGEASLSFVTLVLGA